MEKTKDIYEKPVATVIEFEIKDSIANSGDTGSDAICSEGIFG